MYVILMTETIYSNLNELIILNTVHHDDLLSSQMIAQKLVDKAVKKGMKANGAVFVTKLCWYLDSVQVPREEYERNSGNAKIEQDLSDSGSESPAVIESASTSDETQSDADSLTSPPLRPRKGSRELVRSWKTASFDRQKPKSSFELRGSRTDLSPPSSPKLNMNAKGSAISLIEKNLFHE